MSDKPKRFLTRENAQNYDEDMMWKLDVGAECNRLLDHADVLESFERVLHREQTIKDIRSLVARVAEFEGLEVAP